MKTQELPTPTTDAGLNLNRILVPVDFSPLSEKALQYAQQFAAEFNAELRLLHVLQPQGPPTFEGLMVACSNGNGSGAKRKLNTLANSVRAAGVQRVDTTVRRGLPSHEIVEAAHDLDVDLIVMATHGYTGWKHFCIGSTAERVVRVAPCPVMVVRDKEHEFISTSEYADMLTNEQFAHA